MTAQEPSLSCRGCGHVAPLVEVLAFRCPAHGSDDVDHVLGPSLPPGVEFPDDDDPNPFVRFRRLSSGWQLARARGMKDAYYVALVRALSERVGEVDGHGFAFTPYTKADALAGDLKLPGELWIKDETRNVAGSHKARHLFGIALALEVAERTGQPVDRNAPLAIASCGNAALAAAVIARALRRRLKVFVPPWAAEPVMARLRELGAELTTCERQAKDPAGDPCYLRFREAVQKGALPFACQGPENGLNIEGGMTLGFEWVAQLRASGAPVPDRVFVQVGGGALASSFVQALKWAKALGALPSLPKVHAVQSAGAHPLLGAWRQVVTRIAERHQRDGEEPASCAANVLREAATQRASFMRPVEQEPRSVATGILDDETYDWLEIVRGMLETDGEPIIASEQSLIRARDRGQKVAKIPVDATGAAGLAGTLELGAAGKLHDQERLAVLFTGIQR